jgi:hypothetical protein
MQIGLAFAHTADRNMPSPQPGSQSIRRIDPPSHPKGEISRQMTVRLVESTRASHLTDGNGVKRRLHSIIVNRFNRFVFLPQSQHFPTDFSDIVQN